MADAATTGDNALANPPASGTSQDSGIQQVVNASDSNSGSSAAPTGDSGGDNTQTPSPEGETPPATPPSEGGEGTKKTPWFQRRIDQLTAEKWEERREKENLRQQTAELLRQLSDIRKTGAVTPNAPIASSGSSSVSPPVEVSAGQPTQSPTPQNPQQPTRPQITDAEINAMAESRAQELAKNAAFTKACNDVYSNGKDEYQDFDQALRTFQMLGGIPQTLLEITAEMPNAHKVLYKLGKDLDLAERVVKMTPTRMAMELARVEAAVTKPPAAVVSGAPRPVQPVDGGSRNDKNPESMTTTEWIEWRESELSKKRK